MIRSPRMTIPNPKPLRQYLGEETESPGASAPDGVVPARRIALVTVAERDFRGHGCP